MWKRNEHPECLLLGLSDFSHGTLCPILYSSKNSGGMVFVAFDCNIRRSTQFPSVPSGIKFVKSSRISFFSTPINSASSPSRTGVWESCDAYLTSCFGIIFLFLDTCSLFSLSFYPLLSYYSILVPHIANLSPFSLPSSRYTLHMVPVNYHVCLPGSI